MAHIDAPITLAPSRSPRHALRDVRRLLLRDGAVVYEAKEARTLRKLQALLVDDADISALLAEHKDRYRLYITQQGRAVHIGWGQD